MGSKNNPYDNWNDRPLVDVLSSCATCNQHSLIMNCVIEVKKSLASIDNRLSIIEKQHTIDEARNTIFTNIKDGATKILIGIILVLAGAVVGWIL